MGGTMSDLPPEQQQQPTATPQFSWPAMVGGLFLALIIGGIANIFAGLIGMSTNATLFGFLIGLVPGAIFVGLARLSWRRSAAFGTGMLIGGCIIALIGGICGASMVGTSFR
jgi:hypothetical protein